MRCFDMIRFLKSLPYHFKKAIHSIIRNFGNATSSIFAVTVTLVLIMLFIVLAVNVSGFTTNVEDNVQILVRIDAVVEQDQYTKIEKQVEKVAHVEKVVFSSAEEQLAKLNEDTNGQLHLGDNLEQNPLPAAFYVDVDRGNNVARVSKAITGIDGVLDAKFGGDDITQMMKGFESLRLYGGIFVGVLSILAIFLISNTIKINIYNRRREIGIMRNVGASNGFIKVPFLMEGMVIGVLGSLLPILITILGYNVFYSEMKGNFFTPMFKMQVPFPFVWWISLSLLGIGVLVGIVGSFFSINKYLKFKR